MGNVVSSFFSGFGKVIGDIFGSPLDFLAGKSCNSVCGSTWDFICYIENFCVSHLLKMAMVLVLLYIVLLFLYLLHKLGICECVSWSLCRMLWACFASCLSVCDCCCTFLCLKLRNLRGRTNRRRRRRRKLDIEVVDTSSTEAGDEHHNGETSFASCDYDMYKEKSDSSLSRRKRDYRSDQLRKSLRPRSHRIGAGISKDHLGHGNRRSYNIKLGDHHNHNHDHDHNSRVDHAIRVTRTSKFVRKGTIYKGGIIQRRRSRPMEDDHDQATKQPNDHHNQDHHQRPPRVPFTLLDEVLRCEFLQEQDSRPPFSTLESIESESDTNYDQEDYEFFESSGFGPELGFLDEDDVDDYEGEDMEEDDGDDDDDDELDVDELTYEELIALGEFIGVEKRGLSMNEISSCLHPIVWKTTSSVNSNNKNHKNIKMMSSFNDSDRCVICQIEYEDGEELVSLPNCEHPYHSECISKWLQIKKSCPICSTEVISSSPSPKNTTK